jgi:uncharacterized protein (TIGR03437 family)
MTHASLCKKTYKSVEWLHSTKSHRMDKMRTLIIAVLLSLTSVGVASAQCNAANITPTTVPGGVVGAPYSVNLTEDEGGSMNPVTWTLIAGTLPPGLTLNTGTNSTTTSISGTPTTANVYNFEVQAEYNTSANIYSCQAYQIVIAAACSPTLSPASPLPPGDVNFPYPEITFQVGGCTGGNFTFTEQPVDPFMPNSLPPGITLTSAGVLRGTPTAAGTFGFEVTATSQSGQQNQFQYSLTINPQLTITTSSPLPNGPVGVAYSQSIVATGGTPPYIFSMNANPPGISITQSGVLNGTPTKAGTYNFNIGVTDSLRNQVVTPFQVTFASAVSQILVTPLSLTFSGNLNGAPPPTQGISIVPANGATPPINYSVVVNGGQSGMPAPAWITVNPTSGAVPAGLVVSVDQGTMPAGSYSAGIQILDTNGFPTDIAVTLNVSSVPLQLTVAPAILNFAARAATPGNLTQQLLVSNSGAGSLSFTAASVGNSSWISGITATSNTTTRNAPVSVQVQVNTNGLSVGAYHDLILVSSPSGGNVQIPISLFVATSGPILAVNTTGVLFQAVEGGGSTVTQIIRVLNLGDPGSTVNWNASLMTGSNWLKLVTSSGGSTSTTPSALTLALTSGATELPAGPYYAIVEITDSNSLNSPQYITAVLNLQPSGAPASPDLVPAGLFFTTTAGGAAPPAQEVQINTSSASAVSFTAAASTADNGTWLETPASGPASGQTSGSISVSVNPTGLAPGIYSGDVNVSIGSLLQSVNVTFVVQPASSTNAASPSLKPSEVKPHATGCAASKLAITETGLANNFAVPAGWPATLIVQLNDDCGAPVPNGSVVASFSNGDAPLNMAGDTLGNYSATWQPGGVNADMVVTLNATSGTLQPAMAKLYGGVAQNQTPPPTIYPGGTANNLNPVVGGPLSPGTIAAVYGTGLGTSGVSTGKIPLPTSFNNTYALVGPAQAPLYFLSSGQINLQIPNEATATQQVPIVLSVNNALTLPQMIDIVPVAPGVAATPGGQIIAQHSADFSLVTSASPAKPGEYLIIYLVGMGATKPSVASGAVSPGPPTLATVTIQPKVTVGSQTANVVFAGLTPGSVGLYQIDFQVPSGTPSGNPTVVVTQNGIAANSATLPVSN